jgi:hypothetical protein
MGLKIKHGVLCMIGLHVPNRVVICVDRQDGAKMEGRIFHRLSPQPVPFLEVSQLLLEMENLLDQLGYPQASTAGRQFRKIENRSALRNAENDQEDEELNPMAKGAAQQKGNKATFVVQVQYRQNATWQGTVVWAEKEETKQFRSALELLKLIDSTLDSQEEE